MEVGGHGAEGVMWLVCLAQFGCLTAGLFFTMEGTLGHGGFFTTKYTKEARST